MTWFKVDDGFWRHRKVRRLGRDRLPAAGLWVLAGDYCADNTTDGFLTREEVSEWDPRLRYAARLVDVRLWHEAEVDGEPGYRFHQWEQHQPSREQVLDRRRKRQDAGRRGGIRSGQVRSKPEANASAHASPPTQATTSPSASEATEAKTNPVPTRPVKPASDEAGAASADAPPDTAAQTIVGEWIERCRKRPPRTVIGQISKHVKAMLAEGIASDDIRRGLADWMTRDLHPAVLPSLVNSAMNTRAAPPAAMHPTDANIARLLGMNPPQLPGGRS